MAGASDTVVYRSVPDDLYALITENNRLIASIAMQMELGGQRYLNTRQAAKFIGKSKQHFEKNLQKRIPKSKPDSEYSYDVKDLIAFMESHKIYPSDSQREALSSRRSSLKRRPPKIKPVVT